MYYRRRPPRRKFRDYFKPFIILVVLAAIVFYGWSWIGNLLGGSTPDALNERVFLNIDRGNAKAMTIENSEWNNVPDKIYLYNGEKLKTGSDGRASITYASESTTRLDENTSIELNSLKTDATEVMLTNGRIWNQINASADPHSQFKVKSGDIELIATKQSTFNIEHPGNIAVVKGSVEVNLFEGKKVAKTFTLGVGQEVNLTRDTIVDILAGETGDQIKALSDEAKASEWWLWNKRRDGDLSAFDESSLGLPTEEETSEEELPSLEDTEVISEDITETPDETEEVEEEPVDPSDKEAPSQPEIKAPGETGETVEIDDIDQLITGSVSADTAAVVVNDYTLSKYVPGSKEFTYRAWTALNNLKVGGNEYLIYAKDKNGNVSEAAKITLNLTQEVFDANQPKEETETPDATSSGGVSITAPNGGSNLGTKETRFDIEGITPDNTHKVVVNDYPLSRYAPGSTTWKYRASSALGNLKIGEKNTFTAKAYDIDDKLIGSASITIDVESGPSGAPVITIPTDKNSYATTLNELVISGTVGKWVTEVYVNDKKLLNYIPGSEKWAHTVTLSGGSETFTIYGMKSGERVGEDSINITYTP